MAKLRTLKDKSNVSTNKKASPVKASPGVPAKKLSGKIPSTSKLNKTSKSAISKDKKGKTPIIKKIVKKKMSEVNWVKSLIEDKCQTAQKMQQLKSGIDVHYTSSLSFVKDQGVEYAIFPWQGRRRSGYIKMNQHSEKTPSRSVSNMHFLVVLGKLQLLGGKRPRNFDSGTEISIPKGVFYGLKNTTKTTTFLLFMSSDK